MPPVPGRPRSTPPTPAARRSDARRAGRREPRRGRRSVAPTGRRPATLVPVIGVLGALLVVAVVLAVVRRSGDSGSGSTTDAAAASRSNRPAPQQLPRGGRQLFPQWRVVAFAGAPQDTGLGALGIGSLTSAVRKLEKQGAAYSRKTRPDLPALQLISTIAQAAPGPKGQYRQRQTSAVIQRHLTAARKAKALLVLDVQPGRTSFTSETRHLTRWLREPDVALALDPEWRMGPGQVPGQVIGSVSASEVQRSMDQVAKIVQEQNLPPKLVMVHRFTEGMIRGGIARIRVPRGVVPVLSIDGVGDEANKVAKYRQLTRGLPRQWGIAFKLFYQEDAAAGGLMTPKQVMALRPRPDMVIYE